MPSRKLSAKQVEVLQMLASGVAVTRADSSLALTVYALRGRGLVHTTKVRGGGWTASITPEGELAAKSGWVPHSLPVPRGRATRESSTPARKADEREKVKKEKAQRQDAYRDLLKCTRDSVSGPPDERGMLSSSGRSVVRVSVSRPQLKRAMNLLKLLFAEAAKAGIEVSSQTRYAYGRPDGSRMVLKYKDYETSLAITESAERRDHVPTASEIARQQRYSWDRPPKWDYTPSGRISIVLEKPYALDMPEAKSTFTDLVATTLEERIPLIVEEILRRADRKDSLWRERQRKEAEYLAEQDRLDALYVIAREEAISRAREAEGLARREAHALEDTSRWETAQRLRAYASAVAARANSEESRSWLMWIERHADALDPTTEEPLPPRIPDDMREDLLAHRLAAWPHQRPRAWEPARSLGDQNQTGINDDP